jgi:hypothetical protein
MAEQPNQTSRLVFFPSIDGEESTDEALHISAYVPSKVAPLRALPIEQIP